MSTGLTVQPALPSRARSSNLVLLFVLATLVALPAFAVATGICDGRVVFVIYREAKLAAFMILGGVLLTVFCWSHRSSTSISAAVAVVRRTEYMLLLTLMGYMALTLCWTLVPANGYYELAQYGLLALLLLCLVVWAQEDDVVVSVVEWALIASIGVATVVGFLQMAGLLRFLVPINPYGEVGYPSLMGYKNPMALAVLGQVFILAGRVRDRRLPAPFAARVLMWSLLLAELVYIVTLRSRSAMLGLVVGALFLAMLQLKARRLDSQEANRRLVLAAFVFLVLLSTVLLEPASRRKAATILEYVKRPVTMLESDRATYALNTLNMVRYHPFGIGIGDWQSQYPLYRVHNRFLAFTESTQVRRAHSDHFQLLGEIGLPGLCLWLSFLAVLMWRTARHGIRRADSSAQFLAAQLVAVCTAMCTDYVTEVPYLKFQFFLIVFLSIAAVRQGVQSAPNVVLHPRAATLMAIAVTILAIIGTAYYAGLTSRLVVGGHLLRHYLSATAAGLGASSDEAPEDRQQQLLTCARLGVQYGRLPGHTKTTFRDYLVIADVWYRCNQPAVARAFAVRSLALNPFHVPAFRLMSVIASNPSDAKEWSEASDEITFRATSGFRVELPTGHPLNERRRRLGI